VGRRSRWWRRRRGGGSRWSTSGRGRCDIAEQLGVHPRTVRRALQRGGPPAPRRGRRRSLLDPYRAQVDQLLSEGVWNAVVLLRELQAKGYAGGISGRDGGFETALLEKAVGTLEDHGIHPTDGGGHESTLGLYSH
jgi:excisionase family DNA binding protein